MTDILFSDPIRNLYFLPLYLLDACDPDPPPNPIIKIYNYTPVLFVLT